MSAPSLPIFLGELRAGADIRSAAVVAEMSIEEAVAHAEAELRGEYADVEATPTIWRLEGDTLIFTVPSLFANENSLPIDDVKKGRYW